MPLSSALAPGFIRFAYTGTSEPHHAILPVDFPDTPVPGVEPDILKQDLTTLNFGAIILEYIAAYADNFNAATSFGIAECYAVDPDTGVRTFIWATNIDLTGLNVDPQVPLVGGAYVFKCTSGKPLKILVMEGVYAANARNIGVPPAGPREDFVDYILSGDNFVMGRSNAYPQAFVSFTSKVYDRLRVQSGFSNF